MMCTGVNNPNYSCQLMESESAVTDEEGDFGIIVNFSRKVSSAIKKKSQQQVRDNK